MRVTMEMGGNDTFMETGGNEHHYGDRWLLWIEVK